LFEEAHRGTLLIDEIGELDLALQPKLLRAIECREVQRVGANQWVEVDVRIIAATRRDLDREVLAGRFRDDLFFRLAVGRIVLPPLRRRHGDVALLARSFWTAIAGHRPMPTRLVERLEEHEWPGNVRELQNAIARHVAVGELPEHDPPPLPLPMIENVVEDVLAMDLPLPRARAVVVEAFERRYVQRALDLHGGNVSRAAAAAGVALRYFQIVKARRMRK
jgi:DNA-binding NtrC family response regulator